MRRRIKIVRIITRLIVGGAQQTALNLSSLLDPDRFETVLVSGPATGPEGSLRAKAASRGIQVETVRSMVRRLNPALYAIALRDLRRIIRSERPDIVHTHSTEAGILGRTAARLEGVPAIVHTVHGWGFHDHMNPVLRRTNIAVERRVARWTNRLVVVTNRDRDKGIRVGIGSPEQYVVIRSAIDVSALQPPLGAREEVRSEFGIPHDAPVVGTVGRLSEQKDPEAFLRVARRVLDELAAARFVFVGDGPLRSRVEDLAQRFELNNHLVLTGLRRDVARLLPAFDVFTLTSKWEGLPRAVLEAMAAGVPVVVPAIDGLIEVIQPGRNGLQVPVGDEESQGAAIIRLLTDPSLGAALVSSAKETISEFDLPVMLQRTERLYEDLYRIGRLSP